MGRKNGQVFSDNHGYAEVGEFKTVLPAPVAETAAIIPLVARQAITFYDFCQMFYVAVTVGGGPVV